MTLFGLISLTTGSNCKFDPYYYIPLFISFLTLKLLNNKLKLKTMLIEKQELNFFEGKITNFKDRTESAFEKKHLKSFLRGDSRFTFSKDAENNPIWFPVLKSEKPIL